MHEIYYSLKPLKLMEVGLSTHFMSESDLFKRKSKRDKLNNILEASTRLKMKEVMLRKNGSNESKKKHINKKLDVESSLNEEIVSLQKQLQDQFAERHALEYALKYHPLSSKRETDDTIPKPTKDFIKEIRALELDILYLERYLLSLYRKTFHERRSNEASEVCGQDVFMQHRDNSQHHSGHFTSPRNSVGNRHEREDPWEAEKLLDSSIHRSHSSLSQRSASSSFRASPRKFFNKAVDSYHSLPLSMLEQAENTTPNASTADNIGVCCSEHVPETPNSLSEEMIRCIAAVYCELADPPLTYRDYPSSSSSITDPSSQGHNEMWNSITKRVPFVNSYIEEGQNGPYCRVLKIQRICRESEKLKDVENILQKFRSLIYRLEDADLRKLKHEEKLAFWINVHNALVMHAYLVYGIPQNNLKRVSLILKAAYNVGGHTISVDTIQNSILGCRLPRPGQWLRLLFSSKTKFKVGDARKAFAIEHSEPRLHFALCSGSQSDPAVRVYTPKRVFEELETAKEEYIHSNLLLHKDHKVLVPKIVESFAKDSGLSTACLAEVLENYVPYSRRKSSLHHKKSLKGVEWIPHNFAFHYRLSKELVW